MIRVVVADDQDLVRAGIRAILDAESDLLVVAEACDGREAAQLARTTAADVVLMDVQMAGTDGLDGIDALAHARPEARVLVLTMYDVDDYVVRALRAGAHGFLLKTTPPAELVAGVRAVAAGRKVFAPSVTERLVDSFVSRPGARPDGEVRLRTLTEREREVFDAVARGLSNAEIAGSLFLSEATVKTYVTRILAKLGLRDRVQAVILAYETGVTGTGHENGVAQA